MPRRKKKPQAHLKHPIWADSEIPPDHKGRRWCRRCGVMGKPGDARHSDEFPETPPEDVTNRILGENE